MLEFAIASRDSIWSAQFLIFGLIVTSRDARAFREAIKQISITTE